MLYINGFTEQQYFTIKNRILIISDIFNRIEKKSMEINKF